MAGARGEGALPCHESGGRRKVNRVSLLYIPDYHPEQARGEENQKEEEKRCRHTRTNAEEWRVLHRAQKRRWERERGKGEETLRQE